MSQSVSTPTNQVAVTTPTTSQATASYTVKSGDSLWAIATKHGLSVAQLKSMNNLSSDVIYPGKQLMVVQASSQKTSVNTVTNLATTASLDRAALVAEAYKHIGKPYAWGAKGPDSFDCSGFVRYVYLQVTGRDIGGNTIEQEKAGTVIPVSEAKAGDLYFWGEQGSSYHVALALGDGSYIYAPQPGEFVKVGSVASFAPDFAIRM